jgi:nucleoside-diphosphate kinase
MAKRTLVKVKPDAYAKGDTGNIISHFEKNGFRICGLKVIHLSRERAEKFYEVHKERPFFNDLVKFMTSGPSVPMVIESKNGNAVEKAREIIGATNPTEANEGTIRKLFATDKEKNAIHGSDSDENAEREINFYFSKNELVD